MKFTAKQLMAMEKSIGYPTVVTVRTGQDTPTERYEHYHVGHAEPMSIHMESNVEGKVCQAYQMFDSSGMHRGIPFVRLAGDLVAQMQQYIKQQFFKEAF